MPPAFVGIDAYSTPFGHRVPNVSAEVVGRHGVDQLLRLRPGEDDPVLPQRPAHNRCVAVVVPFGHGGSVVEVDERSPRRVDSTQELLREVRAFEVLSPRSLELVEPFVHGLQRGDLLVTNLLVRDHDVVDVAVDVRVADGERAL
jgi:hypothetical protein